VSGSVRASGARERAAGVELVVLASSLGGISACGEVLASLPAGFPAPVVVVQHHGRGSEVLVSLLQRRTRLAVVLARTGLRPVAGTVYVADGGRQLVLECDGRFAYSDGVGARCRADPLLESAALRHGERLLTVILTGRLDDGARGVVAVKAAGGRVIAQDAESAVASGMPAAAIATGCVDFVLPPRVIAAALVTFVMVPAAGELFRVAPRAPRPAA
jgi:two-component system chemotaxis response regulator CheB